MLLYIKTGKFFVVGFGWKKECFESSHWMSDNIVLAKVFSFCWSSSVIILLNFHGHKFVH